MERSSGGNTLADAAIVTAICFGWFILISVDAVARGFPTPPFTDDSFLEMIFLELILSAFALYFLRSRGYPLRQLLPAPSAVGTLAGLVLFLFAALFAGILTALTQQDFHDQPIGEIMSNTRVSLLPIVGVSVVNGTYEEVFLLGYLQRTLLSHGNAFAVGAVLLVRMLYHLYQGPAGAVSV